MSTHSSRCDYELLYLLTKISSFSFNYALVYTPTLYFYSEPEVFYVPVLRAVDNVMPPHLGSPCTMQELELESPIRDETGTPVMGHALAGPMPSSKVSWPCTGWTHVVL